MKMKNILVPTDFSQNAKVSAYYAAAFASITGARLIIFHAFYPYATLENVDSLGSSEDPEAEAQVQLDLLAHELHHLFGISVTRLLKPGFAADEIPTLAKRVKADLVVMGIQGSNLQVEGMLGKIAGIMLLSDSIPVVCVPAEAELDQAPKIQQLLEDRQPLCNSSGLQLLHTLAARSQADKPVVEEE